MAKQPNHTGNVFGMVVCLLEQRPGPVEIRLGLLEFKACKAIGERNFELGPGRPQSFRIAGLCKPVKVKNGGMVRPRPKTLATDIRSSGCQQVDHPDRYHHGEPGHDDRQGYERGDSKPISQRAGNRLSGAGRLRPGRRAVTGHANDRWAPSARNAGPKRTPYPDDLGLDRMHAELESEPASKAQHALIFYHYIPVQRAHSFLGRPLRYSLKEVSTEAESAYFASHDDGEFRVLAAVVDDRTGDRTDTRLLRRQRLDEHQRKCTGSIHVDQLARMGRSQFGDWMQKSKAYLFGCQITETAPQRIGIAGQYRSRDQLASILQADCFTPRPAQGITLESSLAPTVLRGPHAGVMPRLDLRRPRLDDADRRDAALELLSSNERKLVAGILQRGNATDSLEVGSLRDADEVDRLRLSALRLRNLVEKHTEALRRDRLAARTGRQDQSDTQVETAELRLWICSEALALCRRRLRATAERN